MQELLETKTKQQFVGDAKKGANYAPNNQHLGKNRYERRRQSSISKSTADYNKIDMNTFFKKDILTFSIPVRGETNNYSVTLKLVGVLEELQKEMKVQPKELEWKDLMNAVTRVFNSKNIYVHCTCPDWKYRFQYYSRMDDFSSVDTHDLDSTESPDITNPGNDKGPGCKHSILVLNNSGWRTQLCNSIINYIKRLRERQERLYQTIVFPAVYGEKYSDEIQQQLFNPDTGKKTRNYLPTSKQEIQQANKDALERGRFKKGNTQGIRFAKNDETGEDQVQLDIDQETEEETEV